MPQKSQHLTKADITRALARLGEIAAASSAKIELAIYGGTVMMLAYNCRQATNDIDAIFHPEEPVRPMIAQVAKELNLSEDWMNNGIKVFLAARENKIKFEQLQTPGLNVTRPSANYLLVMKCMAAREPTPHHGGDIEDIKFLIKKTQITDFSQIEELTDKYYDDYVYEETKKNLIKDIIEEVKREKA